MSDVFDPDHYCLGCMEGSAGHQFCPACGWNRTSRSAAHQLPIGTILGGEIFLGRVLGEGGFGITYIGFDLNLNKKLAVKEYFPRDSASRGVDGETVSSSRQGDIQSFAEGLGKFRKEARTLAALGSEPGIVSVLRFLEWNGTGYLVMPYVEGMTFKEFLEQQGGSIDFLECLTILTPVMETLTRLHRVNLLHRDLSPDNIYLPTSGSALLFDFGAARQAAGQATANFSVIVKAGYAPEEQYRRDGQQGPWTDVYGLAATIYRALTGKLPMGALERLHCDLLVPPSALGVQLPAKVEQALLKALAVKAEQRIRSVNELQLLLEQGRPSQQSQSKSSIVRDPNSNDESLKKFAAALMAAVLLFGLGKWAFSSEIATAPSDTPSPKSASPATTAPLTPTPWDGTVEHPLYTSAEGGFSVILPTVLQPGRETLALTTKIGELSIPLTTWLTGGCHYAVGFIDCAKLGHHSTREYLENLTASPNRDNKVRQWSSCKLQGHDGVASRVVVSPLSDSPTYHRSLYIEAGSRLYILIFVGTRDFDWDSEDVNRFFDSFKIL